MGFQQGLSGLNAAARNLDVIGNNVANTNTVGGIDAVLQTYSSTAKSTVIAYILNRIDQANGRRPINQQDEDTPT